jgi:hypothetical protein
VFLINLRDPQLVKKNPECYKPDSGEVHTGLYWGNLSEGDHLKDPGVDGRITLKWIFERLSGGGGRRLD